MTAFAPNRSATPDKFDGTIQVTNEVGRLSHVIIGTPSTQQLIHDGVPLNHSVARHQLPTKADLFENYNAFKRLMENLGVNVFTVDRVEDQWVMGQLFARDLGCVIDQTFVVANLANEIRQREVEGIRCYINKIRNVIYTPRECNIEFGDVIQINDTILLGESNRTNQAGIDFLKSIFPNKDIIKLGLNPPSDSGEVLHLDCGLMPVGNQSALIYLEGFDANSDPRPVLKDLRIDDFIPITQEEQSELATNVLSISPTEIISRSSATRINQELRSRGFTVYEVDFGSTTIMGGSFRCATLPLMRS